MISKLIKTTAVAALLFLGTTSATQAASITPYTFGDTGPDYIGASYGASELSVSTILNNYGYTLGGSAIDTSADQTQIQAFQVTGGSADFSIQLLAEYASYSNDVYVFSGTTASNLTFEYAFTNNTDPIGTSFDFTVADGDYFGFVIHANGTVVIASRGGRTGAAYILYTLPDDTAPSASLDHPKAPPHPRAPPE